MNQADRLVKQGQSDRIEWRSDTTEESLPLSREGFAACSEFALPGGQIIVAGILFQRRVTLAQRQVIPAPCRQERVFHVEHTPVEKAAASPRAFFQQLVNFGVDDLRRKLLRKIRDAGRDRAGHMPFRSCARRTYPERRRPSDADGSSGNDEILLAVRDQCFAAAAPEKSRLEQAGLARSSWPDKQGCGRMQLQLNGRQAAKPLGAKTAEWHAR